MNTPDNEDIKLSNHVRGKNKDEGQTPFISFVLTIKYCFAWNMHLVSKCILTLPNSEY